MGRTERKLKKKTRLERQQIYIDRLSQFNTNAMHEVGKLAMGLRYYASGERWKGETLLEGTKDAKNVTVWAGEHGDDGPVIARKVLVSLGLPWEVVPTAGDPVQKGRESVLKSLSEEMRKDGEDREPDDKSEYDDNGDPKAEYGRYVGDEGKVIPIDVKPKEQKDGEPPAGVPAKLPGMGEE